MNSWRKKSQLLITIQNLQAAGYGYQNTSALLPAHAPDSAEHSEFLQEIGTLRQLKTTLRADGRKALGMAHKYLEKALQSSMAASGSSTPQLPPSLNLLSRLRFPTPSFARCSLLVTWSLLAQWSVRLSSGLTGREGLIGAASALALSPSFSPPCVLYLWCFGWCFGWGFWGFPFPVSVAFIPLPDIYISYIIHSLYSRGDAWLSYYCKSFFEAMGL